MTFLPEEREPTLAILYVDHQNRTRLLSREVNVSELEVSAPSPALPLTDIPAKVASSSLDSNRFLVPISAVDGCAGGGVLVCGGRKWALYEAADTETRGELKEVSKSSRKRTRNQKKSQEETGALKRKANALIEWPWSEVRTLANFMHPFPIRKSFLRRTNRYCSIDSTRVLVGDTFGRIAMLSLASINTTGIILMPLGQVFFLSQYFPQYFLISRTGIISNLHDLSGQPGHISGFSFRRQPGDPDQCQTDLRFGSPYITYPTFNDIE